MPKILTSYTLEQIDALSSLYQPALRELYWLACASDRSDVLELIMKEKAFLVYLDTIHRMASEVAAKFDNDNAKQRLRKAA